MQDKCLSAAADSGDLPVYLGNVVLDDDGRIANFALASPTTSRWRRVRLR